MFGDYPGLKDGEESTGTTILACVYDGGVILGADTRTTTGSYVANRVTNKIRPLHDCIYACCSGSAADTQAIAAYVNYFLSAHSVEIGRLPTVKTAAKLARRLCYENKDQLLAGMIIAGWDPVEGGSIFEIPIGGTVIKQRFAMGGSGSIFLYGFADANYKDDMSREEAKAFISKALSHAMARDGSSGGCIRLMTIEKGTVEREFIPGDQLPFGP
mmetsp:Transcript_6592/g.9928  ORF Transcript_6592/g.9928 Transcript_6592/m.9928 type:complete len:215 (-) Transcript_6592:23-667(-)|eukprot:CAMPEP_0171451764 /NCGR_PEP_ID=MMETSP0945-20130129/136_1 /TAXON_ID=109269 /ORGANISM="Vaucheria litorea, Strain CCMP2940" /LENGTH=214 /DNA_ID=CAMNT_0011976285 /DNA_START=84 /DNA_END=728 /DNA_ORIENTATION=-